jgi:hypothetical protein
MSIQKSRYWMVAFTFVFALLRSGLMFSSVTTTDTGTGISPQMGDVIEEKEMTAVPLVTRSYTDLLALQPGVVSPFEHAAALFEPGNVVGEGLGR